jgi:hypothetical protein
MDHFGTDLIATQRVSTSFQTTSTLVVPVLEWLGGILGNCNLFMAVVVGFLISTIGCGLSTSSQRLQAIKQRLYIGQIA